MYQKYLENDLSRIYRKRFSEQLQQRKAVWKVLVSSYFQSLIPPNSTVLDLGCGYGEFINEVQASKKFGMDLNPDTADHLAPEVVFLRQDCSAEWSVAPESLDFVFTSNFFEHLPDKDALGRTLDHIRTALRPGGRLIAMGPNIRFLHGEYWDFWDHHIALSDLSLAEALETRGYVVEKRIRRFLPYTIARRRPVPMFFVSIYLKLPVFWDFFGKQFLLIAERR